MLVGPVVEGVSEEKTIPILLGKIGVKWRSPIRAQGKQDLLRNASSYARVQLNKGSTHVLYCFDADGPNGPAEERHLLERLQGQASLPERALLCVPVHELEAWLLADEEALGHILGRRVASIASPESLVDPGRELSDLFRQAGWPSGYIKTTHAHRIAEQASDRRLRRCQSYSRAMDALLNPGSGTSRPSNEPG